MSQAKYHPLEELLRLIARTAPNAWYPRHFIRESGADPDQVSALLEHLGQEGLIEKVRGHSLEAGSGVVLTELGQEALRDTTMLDRLIRGEPIRPDDQGAIIRSELMRAGKPYATYVLIAINVAIYFLIPRGRPLYEDLVTKSGAVENGEWWRLLTGTFLHGGPIHILCNMFSLYSVGAFVEQAWGRWRFLAIYFVSGWAGSCLAMAMEPDRGVVGASGAICGVLGAVGAWFLLYRKYLRPEVASNGLWQVGTSIALTAMIGLMPGMNISNWGHLGGGIGGALASVVLHFQRFGFASIKMQPGLRWAIAGCLLLLLPIANYMQMKNAWAKKAGAVARKNDKDGAKDDEDRPVKKDAEGKASRVQSGPFVRHHGKPVRDAVNSLLEAAAAMPTSAKAIEANRKKAATAKERIEKQKAILEKQRDELKEGEYKDKAVEQARLDALSLTKEAIVFADRALGHLANPEEKSRDNLQKLLTAVDDSLDKFKEQLAELDKR